MTFTIKQGATRPNLYMRTVSDAQVAQVVEEEMRRADWLEGCRAYFTMKEKGTDRYQIIRRPALIVSDAKAIHSSTGHRYYLCYEWIERDTRRPGHYIGQFHLVRDEQELIVPINRPLFIEIIPSI